MADYRLTKRGVRRIIDAADIPESIENRDWIAFTKWLADGNTADAIEPDPPPSKDEIDAAAARSETDVKALAAFTPAEARAWVMANVTTLADARTLLARFAAIMCVIARRL